MNQSSRDLIYLYHQVGARSRSMIPENLIKSFAYFIGRLNRRNIYTAFKTLAHKNTNIEMLV